MHAQFEASAPRRLSVAMIVRDEQDVVAETIRSIRSIADEIVVVDTGSTDQTCHLAEQLGARVVVEPWNDDFAAARNRMLAESHGDWILWLNAGETLAADSALQLRRFVDKEAQADLAYTLMVQLPPTNRSGSAEQAAQPRLLPKHAKLAFQGRVRETVLLSLAAAGLELVVAPGTILRHLREHDPQRKAAKAQRNLRLIALETRLNPELPTRTLLALGEACADLNQQDAARQAFERAKAAAYRGSTQMLEAYYGLLTTFDGNPTMRELQLATCLEALEVYPLDVQLLCAMGSYLQNRNQLDLAARSFRVAMEYGQINLETWHLADIDEMAANCLSLTLQLQKKDDEAVQVLETALAGRQQSPRLGRQLLHLYVKQGREPEALALADRTCASPEQRQPMREAVLGAVRSAKKDWTAALGHLQSAYVAGCHDPFCLRWLAVTLLSNDEIMAALPVLRHWQQVEPGNAELATYLKAIADRAQAAAKAETPAPQTRQIRFDLPASLADFKLPAVHPAPQSTANPEQGRQKS